MHDDTTVMPSAKRLPTAERIALIAVAAAGFLLAFWQRPLETFSDTRVELVADPGLFLSRVAQIWGDSIDLGHIQSSQFVGYLFPMGPFFAAGEAIGLPTWVTQRLWIGGLLIIAGCGAFMLLRRMRPGGGPASLLVTGLIYVSSPFVVISLARGTVWLLPYALLPWALFWTHRGVRHPTGWLAPAVLALLIAASAGGVNAAILAWLVLAVVLLGVFESLTGVGLRRVAAFAWRAALLSLLASLWWVVPVIAQALYGVDYLTFTEHPEAILNTPSASESLRLLGYWVAYINGYPDTGPLVPAMGGYLLSPAVQLATFLVPAIAIGGLAVMARWRYGIFFGILLALAVLAMSAGFPQDNALGRAVTDLYYDVGPLQFIRTTYKAAPLAALSIAVLAGTALGVGLDGLWRLRVRSNRRSFSTKPAWALAAIATALLIALWGRPLWAGDAIDRRLFFSSIPTAWTDAVADAQKTTPADTRILALPGDLFGSYRWGETQNVVAPALSSRPLAVRQIVRSSPPSAAQLLENVDALVQNDRLVPGQLPPLLQLMGVGRVLVGTDSSPSRSQVLNPALVERALAGQPGFRRPAATFGPLVTVKPPADRSGPTVKLSQVRAYAAPRPAEPRLSRVHPAAGATILDGDADGVTSLAAVGGLDPTRALFYAGGQDSGSLGDLLADRPTLTFTDSNRRRYSLVSQLNTNLGPTLPLGQAVPREFPSYDPFPATGAAGQTVAEFSGIRSISAPASPGFTLFPEHRPFAAIDGSLGTSWIAESDEPNLRYLDIVLEKPSTAGYVDVRPHADRAGFTRQVSLSVNGGEAKQFRVRRGWNRISTGSQPVRRLRIGVSSGRTIFGLTPAGLDEVRIPGVEAREALRLPTYLAGLARGNDLSNIPMSVVLQRTTADLPRYSGSAAGPAFAQDPLDMADAEAGMRRVVTLPAGRSFSAGGWASIRPEAPDPSLDALTGMSGPDRFSSSGRFEGLASFRASSAFDDDRLSSWQSEFTPERLPWVEWSGERSITVKAVRIRQLPGPFLKATRVNISGDRGGFETRVPADGRIELPATLSTKSLRITVTGVRRLPRSATKRPRPRAVAFADIRAEQLPRATPRRRGSFSAACGALTVRTRRSEIPVAVRGSIAALDSGQALAMRPCGERIALREGRNLVEAPPGAIFSPDHLRLFGLAPSGTPPVRGKAEITPSGEVTLDGAGWLALGQSFSSGWRATCRDRTGREKQLGAPVQIDGFANGWRIDGTGCAQASFSFGPQRAANIAYLISGLTVLALVALIGVCSWRNRRRGTAGAEDAPPLPAVTVLIDDTGQRSLLRVEHNLSPAGTYGADAGPRILYAIAAALVTGTGLYYATTPEPGGRGINFDYPLHHLPGHWMSLAAVVATLAAGTWQLVACARDRRRDT